MQSQRRGPSRALPTVQPRTTVRHGRARGGRIMASSLPVTELPVILLSAAKLCRVNRALTGRSRAGSTGIKAVMIITSLLVTYADLESFAFKLTCRARVGPGVSNCYDISKLACQWAYFEYFLNHDRFRLQNLYFPNWLHVHDFKYFHGYFFHCYAKVERNLACFKLQIDRIYSNIFQVGCLWLFILHSLTPCILHILHNTPCIWFLVPSCILCIVWAYFLACCLANAFCVPLSVF